MDGPGGSEVIGDPDAVRVLSDRARPDVVTWDESPSPTLPLDELVPWWRAVAAAVGAGIDGGRAAGPVRVGRDAGGRARLVEPAAGGPALVVAHPEDLDDADARGAANGAVRAVEVWTVAVADADGRQGEVHGVFRLGDEARTWSATTRAGTFVAQVLDRARGAMGTSDVPVSAGGRSAASGTTVAVVREAAPGAAPELDAPVDAVLLLTGDAAVPVDRRLTVGDLEREMEALVAEIADRVAGPETAIDASVDAGTWLVTFESAHRRATGDLTARAVAVSEAWATLPPPPSVVVVRSSPIDAASVWTVHARTRVKDVVRRRLLRPVVVDVEGRISSVPVTPWDGPDDGDDPWRTLRDLVSARPLPDERPGRGTDPTIARVARALEALAQFEHDVVGALNRATASAGRETVVLVVGPDGRPAPGIERWWPADVRPEGRRRLT